LHVNLIRQSEVAFSRVQCAKIYITKLSCLPKLKRYPSGLDIPIS
jgi:hypothetical protein